MAKLFSIIQFVCISCCWLFALFAVENVNSTGGLDLQQPRPPTDHLQTKPQSPQKGLPQLHNDSSSSGSSPVAAVADQHSPAKKHDQIHDSYPLSKEQMEHGLTEEIMKARIAAQLESGKSEKSKIFHPDLLEILKSKQYYWPHLFYRNEIPWGNDEAWYNMKEAERWRASNAADQESKWRGTGWEVESGWAGQGKGVPGEVKTPTQILKYDMKWAVADMDNADSTDLIEILVTTTNAQKDEMDLNEHVCNVILKRYEISKYKWYQTLMRHLCLDRRDPSFNQDEKEAEQMARTIDDYLVKRNDKDAEKIGKILATANYSQLRLAFEQKPKGMTIRERMESLSWVKKRSHGHHFLQVIDFMLTDVQKGRPHLFATLIRAKMNKLADLVAYNDEDALRDIARILVTRAQIDLPDIVKAFGDFNHGLRGKKVEHGLLNTLKWMSTHWSNPNQKAMRAYIDIVTLVEQPGWMGQGHTAVHEH